MQQPHILSIALEPTTKSDQERMARALRSLTHEDPNLKVLAAPDTGLAVLRGISEGHLQAILDRMITDHQVEMNAGPPEVIYHETIRTIAEGEGRYVRHTGGSGNYGHVRLRVEPNERADGYQFINNIKSGVVPEKYIQAIGQGIQEALAGGVLGGYEIIDIKAVLFDGSYHEVESSEMAFRIAGAMAFKDAARKGRPMILEPVMAVVITTPTEFVDTILADLAGRLANIGDIHAVEGVERIEATATLGTMVGYATRLQIMTSGAAKVSIIFRQYEQRWKRGDDLDKGPTHTGVRVPKGPRPAKPLRGRWE